MEPNPGRKILWHDPPSWVNPATSDYFSTICCRQRGRNQCCLPPVSDLLLSSARFYHEKGKWFLPLFLLMPDHIHMLASFGREHDMNAVIKSWKSYTARNAGIHWQDGFFEHRLRATESVEEKAEYILLNPVRVGLVGIEPAWPYLFVPDLGGNVGEGPGRSSLP